MESQYKELENRLLKRKSVLLGRLRKIETDLDKPKNSDFSEMATERENDEVLEGIGSVGLEELNLIDAALNRMRNGTYGYCISCGEEIVKERLAIIPHASKCTDCNQ